MSGTFLLVIFGDVITREEIARLKADLKEAGLCAGARSSGSAFVLDVCQGPRAVSTDERGLERRKSRQIRSTETLPKVNRLAVPEKLPKLSTFLNAL